MHTSREKLYNFPAIDKTSTIKVLDTFTPAKRKLLLREIAGAFQTTHQQSQWNNAIAETCQWCGGDVDDRVHRMFTCQAFNSIREPFRDLVDHYLDCGALQAELPVLYKHPHYEFFDAIHANMPDFSIEPSQVNILDNMHDGPLVFFTDGSLKHPASPLTRYAAFSVVVDLCVCDEDRMHQAERFLVTKQWPSSLQKLHVARLPREQNIHRAETEAVIKIVESFDRAIIFSDSATTVSNAHKCQLGGNLNWTFMHADSDQMVRLQTHLTPAHDIRKIKAHTDLSTIQDPLQRYWALGNAYADFLADSANANHMPELVSEWEERHSHWELEQQQYDRLANLILQLQFAREQSSHEEPAQPVAREVRRPDLLLRQVSRPWGPREGWTEDWLKFSMWGAQPMFVVQQWLQHLEWETAPGEGTDAADIVKFHDYAFSWNMRSTCFRMVFFL